MLLLRFVFVLVIVWNEFSSGFGDSDSLKSDIVSHDVCSADGTCIPNDTSPRLHCEKVRDKLFKSINRARKTYQQWIRYLPVYLKTQFEQFESNGGEQEFPIGSADRFNILGPVGPKCKTKLEKYGSGDEEKRACGLTKLQSINPVSANSHEECVVFSIGSNNLWQFEEAIVNRTSCRVETFDCTMDPKSKPPKHLRSRVKLHHLCLSDREYVIENRRYKTWSQILDQIELQTAPTFLKMDIEGYEFPVMKSIIDSGVHLPLQISMEIHLVRHEFNEPQYHRRVSSIELHAFMHYLHEFGGYYLIDRHDNPFCSVCSELVLAKIDCENRPLESYKGLMSQSDPSLKKALRQSMKAIYYS